MNVMGLAVASVARWHPGHIRRAASSAFLLAGTPPPCSDEELSKQSRRECPEPRAGHPFGGDQCAAILFRGRFYF